ncbi:MAG TPA: hypothetical protein VFQ52_04145 [Rhizomicrobium sp.]|nr:hypothetical protein [Rhizomicrobium sp.]
MRSAPGSGRRDCHDNGKHFDAALAGLDNGEAVTLPSIADATLWDQYDAARSILFKATQTRKPASRYKIVWSHRGKLRVAPPV